MPLIVDQGHGYQTTLEYKRIGLWQQLAKNISRMLSISMVCSKNALVSNQSSILFQERRISTNQMMVDLHFPPNAQMTFWRKKIFILNQKKYMHSFTNAMFSLMTEWTKWFVFVLQGVNCSTIAIAKVIMGVVLATIVTKPNFYQPDCPMSMEKGTLFYSAQVAAKYIM